MIQETIIQPHARGVAGVLADAGLREKVAVNTAGSAVNVFFHTREREGMTPRQERARLDRIVKLLEEAGYQAHRSAVVEWLVRVTGKRKNTRVQSS